VVYAAILFIAYGILIALKVPHIIWGTLPKSWLHYRLLVPQLAVLLLAVMDYTVFIS